MCDCVYVYDIIEGMEEILHGWATIEQYRVNIWYAKFSYRFNKHHSYYQQVGDNWDELPGTASYCDSVEGGGTSDSAVAGAAGGSGGGASGLRLGAGASSAAVGEGDGSQYNLDLEKQLPGVVMAGQGRDLFVLLHRLSQVEEPR